jgi:hypothetical protein
MHNVDPGGRLADRPCAVRLPVGLLTRLGQDLDVPVRSMHADPLAIPDQLGSMLHPHDGRQAVLDVPAGALVGLAVSAGTVEGRARVVLAPVGTARLSPQSHSLQQARPRRPLRGVGTAATLLRRDASRVPIAPDGTSDDMTSAIRRKDGIFAHSPAGCAHTFCTVGRP